MIVWTGEPIMETAMRLDILFRPFEHKSPRLQNRSSWHR